MKSSYIVQGKMAYIIQIFWGTILDGSYLSRTSSSEIFSGSGTGLDRETWYYGGIYRGRRSGKDLVLVTNIVSPSDGSSCLKQITGATRVEGKA